MADKRAVIIGGHGKIALLTAEKLVAAGFAVDSLIRNPDQRADVERTGANAVVLDVEKAGDDAFAEVFNGAGAVVFSAGAGGGDPDRTRAVDRDAAIRSMDAAERAGVDRYVMVSYSRSATDIDTVARDDPFYPYAAAKHEADNHLRETGLDWTILGPGILTLDPASGSIRVLDAEAAAESAVDPASSPGAANTSRENVADVITYVLAHRVGQRRTVNFYDGGTPIAQAFR